MLLRPFPQGKLFKAIAEGMEQGWLDMPGLEAAYGIPLGEVWKPCLSNGNGRVLSNGTGPSSCYARRAVLAGELSQLLLDYLKRSLEA